MAAERTVAKDWASIRAKTNAANFNAVRAKIMGWPEEVAEEIYYPQLEIIAQNGKASIRRTIEESTTRTGEERASKGGKGPGRIKSEKMYNSVRARVRKRKNGFSAFVGWLDGTPGYAAFQELGVPGRIDGMNAIGQAREEMLSQIKALAAGRYVSPTDNMDID